MINIAIICSLAVSSSTLAIKLQNEIEKRKLSILINTFTVESCKNITSEYRLALLMPQLRYNLKNISTKIHPVKTVTIPSEYINTVDELLNYILENM